MTERTELVKGLGLYGATSVVAGTMIGTAIFVVPSIMLREVGKPVMVVVVWAFAGLLSLCGALGYAELGAAIPKAGGEYVYLRRACSPMMGFLYGWTQFVVAKAASIAAIAAGFALYLSYFFPQLSKVVWSFPLSLSGHALVLKLTGLQGVATAMILLLSGLNILGVRQSGAVQTVFTASKLLVLAILIGLGLTLGHGSFEHFRSLRTPASEPGYFAAFGVAMVSALWAYDGWNNLSMVAAEVENPGRNIPAALIFGSLLVLVVYVLVNIAYFFVLAPADVVSTSTVAADTARRILGRAGGAFVAVGVMISTFATLNGSILSGSRIPYAQACDGLFPRPLARVNRRFHTPALSIVAQACLASIFSLGGEYQGLLTKAIISEWFFYAVVTGSIFVLRAREPELARPYRTWGYPFVPVIFIILALGMLANTYVAQRSDFLWCTALMGTGIPAYFLWIRWKRKTV